MHDIRYVLTLLIIYHAHLKILFLYMHRQYHAHCIFSCAKSSLCMLDGLFALIFFSAHLYGRYMNQINIRNFKVLDHETSDHKVRLLESIYINKLKPSLNFIKSCSWLRVIFDLSFFNSKKFLILNIIDVDYNYIF